MFVLAQKRLLPAFLDPNVACYGCGMRKLLFVCCCLSLPVVPQHDLAAHPGGLDAKGCHTNRKTGDYHCHQPRRAARPASGRSLDGRVYFPNCTAAREAGFSNIRRGEPGYRQDLDRDNDGIACESR